MSQTSFPRRLLAGAGALVAGSAVMLAVQAVNYGLFPPPAGLDFEDPAHLEAIAAAMPLAAWLVLEASYALGSGVAGAVASWISRESQVRTAAVVGALFTVLGLVNLSRFPTPVWMAVLTTVTYLPAAWAGGMLVARRRGAPRS